MNCARIRIETFLSEKDFEREQRSFCALDDDGRKNDESKSMPTPSTSFDIGIQGCAVGEEVTTTCPLLNLSLF